LRLNASHGLSKMPDDWRHAAADYRFVEANISSPNYNERRDGILPDMVILHYTGMENADGALNWLCQEKAQVSCHYFVYEDGRIVQLVGEDKRAWHAGQSCWKGETDINSRSIGIEIANPGHQFGYVDFPEAQMDSVIKLVGDIVARHAIPAADILAHSDVAPTRKEDPGERFDWRLLHAAGLGIWVEPSPIIPGEKLALGECSEEVKNFQSGLGELGFEIAASGDFDDLTFYCTKAFQRHFRQEKVDGIDDLSTIDTLNRLLEISRDNDADNMTETS
jgi:N-acetylmuramoyl-L-alanine amidase